MLVDPWGRSITYLRISVTDRCNLRCIYCMPPQGVAWRPHSAIMRYEEIAEVVRVAAENGIRKVRLTGGEPLVRADLPRLVQMLSRIPGIEDKSLTTNGILLEHFAEPLARAGLNRVNISLDTLKPGRFARITRGGHLDKVLRAIEIAEACNLSPIKINVVVMRGVNLDEVSDFARLTLEHPWEVRFIELMPIQDRTPWGEGLPSPSEAYVPLSEVMERLATLGLEPTEGGMEDGGPATLYRLPGAKGTLGFISPLSEKEFCRRCNRLRLTADGNLRPCLMSDLEIPLLPALRAGQPILPFIKQAVALKPQGHQLSKHIKPSARLMAEIGG